MNQESFKKKWLKDYRSYRLTLSDKVFAFFIFLFALIFYTLHLTPGVSAGDNGELTSAVYYLGVAHAPGYPIHTLFAKIFTFIPWGNVAWRVNLFSAFCGALTVRFAMLVFLRVLFSLGLEKNYAYLSCVIGAVVLAMSKTLWSQSVTTEVYTISAIFHPLLFYILLKWQDNIYQNNQNKNNQKDLYFGENYLLVFAFLLGLGLGGHQTIIINQLYTVVFLITFFWFFQIRNRINYQNYFKEFQGHLFVVLLLVGIAWGFYFYYIVRYQSNLFNNGYKNLKPGVTIFILCYLILLVYYLYYRWLAPSKIAKNQIYHRVALLTIKFFGMVFLGFSIYFYVFIRAHGNPPLNWGGINELSDLWGKLAKFFIMINRKQFPQNPLPISFYNLSIQLNLLFTKVINSQFSWPFFLVMILGMVTLYRRCRIWLYLFLFSFFIYIIALTLFIKFDFNKQDLFFIEVFYIYAYFLLSLFIPLGVYQLLEWNEKLLKKIFLKKLVSPKIIEAKQGKS